MRELLSRGELPTAVFAGNVLAAVGAISACSEAGIRVPEDMSIIGMHDVFVAEHLVPKLTVVKLPLREMGARAVSLLLSQSPESRGRHETIRDPAPEVIVRASTSAPPSGVVRTP
jgi:DNA-binding LacI/PurR family transcriptional regulator